MATDVDTGYSILKNGRSDIFIADMSASPAIHVEKLSKRYRSWRGGVDALVGVTFDVDKGDVFGFLGPNGAGKTSTLRIIATVSNPTGGTIVVNGFDVRTNPMRVRSVIGYVPEDGGTYPLETGAANLFHLGRLQGMNAPSARERAKTLLEDFGLADSADRKVNTYSHGMRRRLLVAQALMHDPPILLLDEPSEGLDPSGIRFFRNLIRELHARGKTIFLSSHILSEVQQTCRTIGIIQNGRMLAVDRLDALRNRLGPVTQLRIDVECDTPDEGSIRAVEEIPDVVSASSTGPGMVVEARPATDIVEKIVHVLLERNLRLRSIRQVEPALEEVFLALTGDAHAD